jgi:hypothetical protein
MAEMTQGSLVLKDVRDHVDVMKGEAWLSFSGGGRKIKFDCKVDGKWLDPAVLSRFVSLLKVADPSKIYILEAGGGQDCLVGCVTKNQLKKLTRLGIKFVPLE